MHKPLRSREDILDFAARHAPSNACARAIRENRVSLDWICPIDSVIIWVLDITSRFGRVWRLQIRGDDSTREYRIEDVTPTPTPEPETSTRLRGHADGETPPYDRRVQVGKDREESRQVTDDDTDKNGD